MFLDSTKVTDARLKELAGLKTLQTLDLADTEVTDAGLKEIADSPPRLYEGDRHGNEGACRA